MLLLDFLPGNGLARGVEKLALGLLLREKAGLGRVLLEGRPEEVIR